MLCVQWKTPHDGQRNCPKHVEFYSKNKFEKLVNLVGFIIKTDYWIYRISEDKQFALGGQGDETPHILDFGMRPL